MPLKFMLIVIAGAFLSVVMYAFGWFNDKNFRLVMRKKRISAFGRCFLHFRGTKLFENRGHAVACVKYEKTAPIVFVLCLAVVTVSRKVLGDSLTSFAVSAGFELLLFLIFILTSRNNILKYKERKKIIESRDETGFDEFTEPEKTEAFEIKSVVKVFDESEKTEEKSGGNVTSFKDGIEIVKNKGLLDDDIYNPLGADYSRKYRAVSFKGEFADGSSIQKGKEELKDKLKQSLIEESFSVNKRQSDSDKQKEIPVEDKADSVGAIIESHIDEINPEAKFKKPNTPI